MGRWFLVRFVAWLIRPGKYGHPRMTLEELDPVVRKAYPHPDWAWRAKVYEDAGARNQRKLARR